MAVSPDRFRDVLGRLAGGVAVVTSRHGDGSPSGLTATAVCSVSLAPPLVLACLDVDTSTHEAVETSGIFALNLLTDGDADLARRFGGKGGEKFEGLAVSVAETGAPLLGGGLGFCDCSVVETVPAGDHTIFVGRVEAAEPRGPAGRGPLLYYRGAYAALGAGAGRDGPGRPGNDAADRPGDAGRRDADAGEAEP